MVKPKRKTLTPEQRWALEDAELEAYCRWPDEWEDKRGRLVLMADPVDPWDIALRSARGRRKRFPGADSDD